MYRESAMIGRIRHTLLLFLLFVGTAASAQIFEVDNSVDAKYTPPEGSIFNTDVKVSGTKGVSMYAYKNTIMFNMTALARGALALEYERALTGSVVVMGTIGTTLYQDYMKVFFVDILARESDAVYDRTIEGPGLFYGAEFKFYLGDAFDDEFICFGVRGFNYQLSYTPTAFNTGYSNIPASEFAKYSESFTEKNRDLYFGYGISAIATKNFVHEISWYLGIRQIRSADFSFTELYGSSSWPGTGSYSMQKTRTDYTHLTPTFNMSYKLGFAFGE